MKTLIIMRGLPGSGKSTKAKSIQEAWWNDTSQPHMPVICSTDAYWLRPDGAYDWNPRRIKEAHDWNKKRANDDLAVDLFNVIIDNTNVLLAHMQPYIDLGQKYGYRIEFVEPDTEWKDDPDQCFLRNTHNVPYEAICKMAADWEEVTPEFVEKANSHLVSHLCPEPIAAVSSI